MIDYNTLGQLNALLEDMEARKRQIVRQAIIAANQVEDPETREQLKKMIQDAQDGKISMAEIQAKTMQLMAKNQ